MGLNWNVSSGSCRPCYRRRLTVPCHLRAPGHCLAVLHLFGSLASSDCPLLRPCRRASHHRPNGPPHPRSTALAPTTRRMRHRRLTARPPPTASPAPTGGTRAATTRASSSRGTSSRHPSMEGRHPTSTRRPRATPRLAPAGRRPRRRRARGRAVGLAPRRATRCGGTEWWEPAGALGEGFCLLYRTCGLWSPSCIIRSGKACLEEAWPYTGDRTYLCGNAAARLGVYVLAEVADYLEQSCGEC